MIEKVAFGAGLLMLGVFACTPRGDSEIAEPRIVNKAHSWSSATKSHKARPTGQGWAGLETVLAREMDGHFYATADVNGMATRFLVDTGASVVALTGADARALGLDWDDDDIRPIGSGASGAVHGVPAVIDTIELDGHSARSVRAVIIPEGLEISLLGQSFLSTISDVSIRDNQMVLSE